MILLNERSPEQLDTIRHGDNDHAVQIYDHSWVYNALTQGVNEAIKLDLM